MNTFNIVQRRPASLRQQLRQSQFAEKDPGANARQCGMVLLVVLATMAVLVPLIFHGIEQQRFQITRIQNELDLQSAYRQSESTLSKVIQALSYDGLANEFDHLGEVWALPFAIEQPDATLVVAQIEDGARYWNVNDLIDSHGQVDLARRDSLARLLREQGLEDKLLDSLIDWLDNDDLPTGFFGAEADYYISTGAPYQISNHALAGLDELQLVRGWTPEVLTKLRGQLTVDPACSRVNINVNTAGAAVLRSLSDGWSESQVEFVIERRKETPFATVSEMLSLPAIAGVTLPLALLTTTSDCFVGRIRTSVGNVHALLEANLYRQEGVVKVTHIGWNE